jgi:hypothetical protein
VVVFLTPYRTASDFKKVFVATVLKGDTDASILDGVKIVQKK